MKRLSIIVPMYNVASYVERCIRSLEEQDISTEDYEIICINDGSPDASRDVIIVLQKEFENIILIDQENQGVSSARNNGMKKASGRYLIFIDPDDYVDPHSFSRVLACCEVFRAQVSFLGYTILNEDGRIKRIIKYDFYIGKSYNGIEAYFLSRGDGQSDPDRMAGVILESEFIKGNDLFYLPGIPYLEDGEFSSRILCLAEKCIFVEGTFYWRTTRTGSATVSDLFHSEKATNGFLVAAENLKRFQCEHNLNIKQRAFLNQPICKFVVLVITSSTKPFSFKRLRNIRKKLIKSGLGKVNLDSVDNEFTTLGTFYNMSVCLLVVYQFLINRFRSIRFLRNRINV